MDPKSESLDEIELIAALLCDVSNRHGLVFNTRARKLTLTKVNSRYSKEGIGFLTKTLPRLGKALDKALSEDTKLSAVKLGFKPQRNSELPIFLGEFFNRIFDRDATILPNPCTESISVIRQICTVFYKYELDYTDDQEQKVVAKFEKTEQDLTDVAHDLAAIRQDTDANYRPRIRPSGPKTIATIAREARHALARVLQGFSFTDIIPRHGPGAVAQRQRLWSKYHWTNISERITQHWPIDAYFCASLGHVADSYRTFSNVTNMDLPARVILVQKDSRGPRLISCEPIEFQWIQQGIMRSLVPHIEHHRLTRDNVFFTDQSHNRIAALYGSQNGRYSTIDLNEASDRVSVDLVRLLFPEHVLTYLESCRSSSTELPDGRILKLQKFAPMGSALCFPILALTIWSILHSAAPDQYTRERILVYGDDVIVPTAYAVDAMKHLESFGLKINRDKSCIKGFFRESCGMDAYKGVNVTPVRIRTVWSSHPSASVYTSWIAYANSFYDKQYFNTYELIVRALVAIYGPIPSDDMKVSCPSLRELPAGQGKIRSRWNKHLHRREFHVRVEHSPVVDKVIDGWSMLLRYFTSTQSHVTSGEPDDSDAKHHSSRDAEELFCSSSVFAASQYTKRQSSILVRRWR